MNINDVSKREILDFKEFRSKVHDDGFKPLNPENQQDSSDKTGIHKISRNPAYDFVGYADAVFGGKSKIDLPGYNASGDREYTIANAAPSILNSPNSYTSSGALGESLDYIKSLKKF